MIKNISKLEYKIGERVYQLLCDSDSPLSELKEVLFELLKFIGKIEDQAKANQSIIESKEEEKPSEQPNQE